MANKSYKAPSAEFIYLAPQEELSAGWFWGNFKTDNSSVKGLDTETLWQNPFDFNQSDESYKRK